MKKNKLLSLGKAIRLFFFVLSIQERYKKGKVIVLVLFSELFGIAVPMIVAAQISSIIFFAEQHGLNNETLFEVFRLLLIQFVIEILRALFMRLSEREEKVVKEVAENALGQAFMAIDYEIAESREFERLIASVCYNEKSGEYNMTRAREMMKELIGVIFNILFGFIFASHFFASFGVKSIIVFIIFAVGFSLIENLLLSKKEDIKKQYFNIVQEESVSFKNLKESITDKTNGCDIRIYNMKNQLLEYVKHEKSFRINSVMDQNAKKVIGPIAAIINVMKSIRLLIICLCVVYLVRKGYFELSYAIKYTVALEGIMNGILNIGKLSKDLVMSSPYYEQIWIILHKVSEKDKIKNKTKKKEPEDKQKFVLEMKNVSFRYSNEERWVLKDICIKLKENEKIAIVGENGAGKTTFIKLLCGLLQPTEGKILLNGRDISFYPPKEYLKFITVVFQDFYVFPFRLGENITMKSEYNWKSVVEQLEETGTKFCFRNKIEDITVFSVFNKDGIELSEGERQKIAILRALFKKNTKLLIMDEPTSSLDPVAEQEVYQSLNNSIGNRSAVFISHRMSSCRFCDQIFVFDKGKIIQSGDHDELLKEKEGKYYSLWKAQADYYK
jgi:ATP-binding cassette subfamily B protein